MSVTSENKKVQEDGQEKDAVTITFTNGAKQQLEELKNFLNKPTELDVIKLGISLLENYKEEKAKKEQESATNK